MPVYRAKYEVEVEADVNYTAIRERDTPYPNDRTAIGAFEALFGENLISIENLEIIGSDSLIFPPEAHDEPVEPLGDMTRAQLNTVARSLGIDPVSLSNKASVIVAIDLVRKSG